MLDSNTTNSSKTVGQQVGSGLKLSAIIALSAFCYLAAVVGVYFVTYLTIHFSSKDFSDFIILLLFCSLTAIAVAVSALTGGLALAASHRRYRINQIAIRVALVVDVVVLLLTLWTFFLRR